MTKIRLTDGTILNASNVVLEKGVLKITTTDFTVEELAVMFSDKANTSTITLLTESGEESGIKKNFTSFAGIMYGANCEKTVELLYQATDSAEARISNMEKAISEVNQNMAMAEEQNAMLSATVDSILTEIIPSLGV